MKTSLPAILLAVTLVSCAPEVDIAVANDVGDPVQPPAIVSVDCVRADCESEETGADVPDASD